MANPAKVSYMVVGVGNPSAAHSMVAAIKSRGVQRAWVVHGHGGLDELSLSGPCHVVELRDGLINEFSIDAKDLGLQPADVTAVRGGDPAYNAAVVRKTLSGEKGAVRDIVLLNAAAGLVVAGLAPNMAEGLDRAVGSIDSGAASNALDKLIAVSSSVAR